MGTQAQAQAQQEEHDEMKQQQQQQEQDKKGKKGKNTKNTTSSLGLIKSVLPRYFSSEWSLAQFRVPDVRTIVAFGADETSIVVVSSDGTFYKATFDPNNGGDCHKVKDDRFLKNMHNDYGN